LLSPNWQFGRAHGLVSYSDRKRDRTDSAADEPVPGSSQPPDWILLRTLFLRTSIGCESGFGRHKVSTGSRSVCTVWVGALYLQCAILQDVRQVLASRRCHRMGRWTYVACTRVRVLIACGSAL